MAPRLPGALRHEDGNGLFMSSLNSCGNESFQTDHGDGIRAAGYQSGSKANWVKRFTPSCYPFELTDVEVLTWHSSVSVGRAIRILVYLDESGSGDPANASLVYEEDTTIQVVSTVTWNRYTLAAPVLVTAGDMYVGFYDLVSDPPDTLIMSSDSSSGGDSWLQPNSTNPAGLDLNVTVTWRIRASGSDISATGLGLDWGLPCNDAAVPDQDFAIYMGSLSDFTSYSSVTCSTTGAMSVQVTSAPEDSFWLVVPQTSVREGSYGLASSGERLPAALACRTQNIAACP
jgi:hypothetical protein